MRAPSATMERRAMPKRPPCAKSLPRTLARAGTTEMKLLCRVCSCARGVLPDPHVDYCDAANKKGCFAGRTQARMEERFASTCSELGVDVNVAERWRDRVFSRYNEPKRRYHTLQHLAEMFGYFDQFCSELTRPTWVAMAIFFHDVVYEGVAVQDEAMSADLFLEFAREAGLGAALDLQALPEW